MKGCSQAQRREATRLPVEKRLSRRQRVQGQKKGHPSPPEKKSWTAQRNGPRAWRWNANPLDRRGRSGQRERGLPLRLASTRPFVPVVPSSHLQPYAAPPPAHPTLCTHSPHPPLRRGPSSPLLTPSLHHPPRLQRPFPRFPLLRSPHLQGSAHPVPALCARTHSHTHAHRHRHTHSHTGTRTALAHRRARRHGHTHSHTGTRARAHPLQRAPGPAGGAGP